MDKYDVIVIGGGLAGCAAAITLAKGGAKVAVLEAGDYPRHRVCGEFLSPESLSDFDALGVRSTVEALNPPRMRAVQVTTPSGTVWESPLPGEAIGLSRYSLDVTLAARSREVGAEVHTHTRATGLSGKAGEWIITSTSRGKERKFHTKTTILAYGKRGTLDRTLNRPFAKHPAPYIGLKMHFDGQPISGRVEMHSFHGGYIGLNEVECGAINACLLGTEAGLRKAGSIPAYISWIAEQNPIFGKWYRTASPRLNKWSAIAQVSFQPKQPAVDGAIAVGDTAGLIAPLAGDGMAMAMASGRLAAFHTLDALRGTTSFEDATHAYQSDWQAQFKGRLRIGRFLQTWMLRPGALDIGLTILNTLPPLGRTFVKKTRGPVNLNLSKT